MPGGWSDGSPASFVLTRYAADAPAPIAANGRGGEATPRRPLVPCRDDVKTVKWLKADRRGTALFGLVKVRELWLLAAGWGGCVGRHLVSIAL